MRARALAVAKWFAITLIAAVLVFALAGWIGSSIPRNADWVEPDDGVEILIGTNGIHTEIVMPLVTQQKDWRETFPASDVIASGRGYTHVSASWGERKFFLETPTWADVNPLTVLGAMTGGEAVLHVAHYVRPAPSDNYRVLRLTPEQYQALTAAIEAHLVPAESREVLSGYGTYDVFYTARGTYHIGNTCNQWTSDQLAAAGVRIGAWSPFPGGVMKWMPESPAN